ncbi:MULTISPECIES: hypothetical protein [unclassified Streptomyces]|uniref:hypothetical protein n=1 Tax=unclassified Streptomyces TaxID=2593676 RepID=UPI0033912486
MARRTMADRRRRTAERAARREVLAHLLSRVDRGVITAAERPLLRAHVEAELRDSDDLRRTVGGQQTALQRQAAQLAAAHDAIREAEQYAIDYREQLHMYRAVEEQRQAARLTTTSDGAWNPDPAAACIHPEHYEGECPCPPSCGCCMPAPAATEEPRP